VQAAVIVTGLAGAGRSPLAKVPPPTLGTAQRQRNVNVAMIANAHLFGAAPPQALQPGDPNQAQQTSLPLVLTGVIAANNPQNGLAILGQSAQTAKVYAVGDNVPGGAKLHSVYSDKVIIDRGGTLESLMLPRQVGAGMPNAPPPTAAALPVQSPVMARMSRIINDQPSLIGDVMRPQPVFADGKQRGFRVYPGRNRQAFVRLGLHAGDLVTAINGTPLDDPSRGQEILRTLGSSPEAHITVTRNGQQQDLTLNMAQVAQEAEALAGPQVSPGEQAQPASSMPAPMPAEPPSPPDSTQ
jgi:general secretion pathway protein C